MCDQERHGTVRESLENVRQPMPLRRKLYLIVRNYLIRLRTASTCCGNYGEPGC
jgi:hypothetical protein